MININMDKMKVTVTLCVVVLNIIFTVDGFLMRRKDCRTQEGGPYYFKKINDKTYRCVRDGPEFECPTFWAIPSWYTYGSTDPCVCRDVPGPGYDTSRVCPSDPMAGARTTETPVTPVPMAGTIGDMGCPHPFQRFANTLRIYNLSRSDGREFPITGQLGFLTSENECKYHCLSIGSCAGVTYSEQDGEPKCVGFFITATSYDFRGSEFHSYFEKVWCVLSSQPILPTPPPIQDGLLLMNTQQTSGNGKILLTNVKELSCYSWCYYEPTCAAVDYNKMDFTCKYYTSTSCDAHESTLDHCCNHYKKTINQCP